METAFATFRLEVIIRKNNKIIIVDLKTCQKANKESIGLSVINFEYYIQAAMYTIAAWKNGYNIENGEFIFCFQEKKKPYSLQYVWPAEIHLEFGQKIIEYCVDKLNECFDNPDLFSKGYSDKITTAHVPSGFPNKVKYWRAK